MRSTNQKALVVLSGGGIPPPVFTGPSTILLCDLITFDYGQRHLIELEAAQGWQVAGKWNHPHRHFQVLGGNALTGDESVVLPILENFQIPLFRKKSDFSGFCSCIYLQKRIKDLVTGVCQTDFSGIRLQNNTVEALQVRSILGWNQIRIHTLWCGWPRPKPFLLKSWRPRSTCLEPYLLWESPPCECPACDLRKKDLKRLEFLILL